MSDEDTDAFIYGKAEPRTVRKGYDREAKGSGCDIIYRGDALVFRKKRS